MQKLILRTQTFLSLKKQLSMRGSNIKEIFENIKGLGKYRDENLSLEEYFTLFQSVEFIIEKEDLK